ncbi:MFS transporter [Actinoallomurus iriomotensis]|uniref:MFS transporter n=2 Tax=Actinoallomurus TaxID=667113 RepID=A0A9W6RRB5_9ACTN|nr:MFS transporter [Actinoallomurus iriomotensis]GLY80130.1 MFS transporter [Actinoallomurus iriomotensis]
MATVAFLRPYATGFTRQQRDGNVMTAPGTAPARVGYGSVFAVREFRALWAGELFSQVGDQFARVALAVLVYQRTSSALLTGLVYALTYIPSFIGGVLLGGLADRHPRREVVVTVDVLRAVLTGLMAIPGLPLPVLCVLLTAMTTLGGPFKGAQLALLADVLTGDRYVLALSIRHMTIQSAQVGGFLVGGVLAQAVSPSAGLGVDALSFGAAALLVRFGVHARPAPTGADVDGPPSGRRATGGGLMMVLRHPGLRSLTALSWLAGCYIVPEGIAAPYADAVGAGTAVTVGLIMASDPIGSVVGAFVFGRFVPEHARIRALGPIALLAGVPLALCALRPGLAVSALLFAMSGALATAYHMQIGASFVQLVPASSKAEALGAMSSGLITVQGLGALVGGGLSDLFGAANTVAIAGVAGILLGLSPARTWMREARAVRSPDAAEDIREEVTPMSRDQ